MPQPIVLPNSAATLTFFTLLVEIAREIEAEELAKATSHAPTTSAVGSEII